MVIIKFILITLGILIGSLWLSILIGAGVEMGLKNYFRKSSKKGGRSK